MDVQQAPPTFITTTTNTQTANNLTINAYVYVGTPYMYTYMSESLKFPNRFWQKNEHFLSYGLFTLKD